MNPAYVHPLDCVVWQDALLQAYRNFLLVLQSIFIAVGVGLTTAVLGFSDPRRVRLAGILLWGVGLVAIALMSRLRRVVKARGEAVSYWQRELIRLEYSSPQPRCFSAFRVWLIKQAEGDASIRSLIDANSLTEEQVSRLLEHGGARMRKVMDDSLYWAVLALWVLFLSLSSIVVFETFGQ